MAILPTSALASASTFLPASGLGGAVPMAGGAGLDGAVPLAGGAGLDGAVPMAGGAGLDGAVPLAGGAGIPAGPTAPGHGSPFDQALDFIDRAASQEAHADALEKAFAQGKDVPIHRVMAAAEEAELSLETLVALRDRVLTAVDTLTKMQV